MGLWLVREEGSKGASSGVPLEGISRSLEAKTWFFSDGPAHYLSYVFVPGVALGMIFRENRGLWGRARSGAPLRGHTKSLRWENLCSQSSESCCYKTFNPFIY